VPGGCCRLPIIRGCPSIPHARRLNGGGLVDPIGGESSAATFDSEAGLPIVRALRNGVHAKLTLKSEGKIPFAT